MKVDLSHLKNPAMGWDVVVKAAADPGEKISSATVTVNGATVAQESLDGMSSWTRTLRQQGYYPGRNTVKAEVTNDKGEDTVGEDVWE
jgi:hypothetical protein